MIKQRDWLLILCLHNFAGNVDQLIVGSLLPSIDYWYLCAWSYENIAGYDFYRLDCESIFCSNFVTYAGYLLLVFRAAPIGVLILSYLSTFSATYVIFATRRTGEIVSRFTDANRIIDALASTIFFFLDVSSCVDHCDCSFSQNSSLSFDLVRSRITLSLFSFFMKPFEKMIMRRWSLLSSSIWEISMEWNHQVFDQWKQRYQIDKGISATYLKKVFAYGRSESLQKSWKLVARLILNVLILWLGATLVAGSISLGQLITYITLLVYLLILWKILSIYKREITICSCSQWASQWGLFGEKSEFEEKHQGLEPLQADIDFRGVSYKYGYGANVLSKWLAYSCLSKTNFVGVSGSGKINLDQMMVRFTHQIHICLGGVNLNQLSKQALPIYQYLPQQHLCF